MRWRKSFIGLIWLLLFSTGMGTGHASFIISGEAPSAEGRSDTPAVTVQRVVAVQAVRERLEALGLSEADIQERLARLSPHQTQKLTQHLQVLQAGGHLNTLEYVLIVILIVLLIILAL